MDTWRPSPSGGHSTPSQQVALLQRRHRRLVPLLAQGLSNRECAGASNLSVHTVETYVSEIMAALGVENRTRLVIACQALAEFHEY